MALPPNQISHNGTTPSRPTEFTDLDAFAANTYSRSSTSHRRPPRPSTPGSTGNRNASPRTAAVIGTAGEVMVCLAAAEVDKALREQERAGVDSW